MKKFYYIIALLFIVNSSQAQWDGNPASVNNPVATTTANDAYDYSISDGAGGVIVVWVGYDYFASTATVYAQHKTTAGALTWGSGAAAPLQLFSSSIAFIYDVSVVDVKADGSGGAYVSWGVTVDDVTANVYLQHLSANGAQLFTAGGIQIQPKQGAYTTGGKLCADNAGVIISWNEQIQDIDSILPSYAQVVLQRYSSAGVTQWGTGVLVSTVNSFRAIGELVSDGSNGVFVAFTDARNSNFDLEGNSDNLDIFAQHISSTGNRLWGAQDALVTTAGNNQLTLEGGGDQVFSSMVVDSAGGFILVYEDYRTDNNGNPTLYAQRLNSSGTRLWAANGVALYSAGIPAAGPAYLTALVNDGANGLVASMDAFDENTFESYIMAQRITGAGLTNWGADGVVVNGSTSGSETGTITADGAGAYVAAWTDNTAGSVKAQKLNGAGQPQWTAGGVNICTNLLASGRNPTLVKSTGISMIAVWTDSRNAATNQLDLYAAKLFGSGSLVNTAVYISIANGNWNNPATWQGNAVPPSGADVQVRTAVVGNVDAVCNTLTVQSPGALTVQPGIHLTVLN